MEADRTSGGVVIPSLRGALVPATEGSSIRAGAAAAGMPDTPSVAALQDYGPRAVIPGAARVIARRGKTSIQQRILLITQVADKVPTAVLADRYGVSKRTVNRHYEHRESTWAAASRGVPHWSTCAHDGKFPLVDRALFDWFIRVRGSGLPVSRLALQVRAGELSGTLHPGVSFQASNGYVERWRKRNAIRSVRLHGAGGTASAASVEIEMAQLREKLTGVHPSLIINMDEAALFYQLAPTKSYVLSRDARIVRGTALQRAKARITVIFCVNATGTFKFLSVICSAATPVCFRGHMGELPIKYYNQRNGWMDKVVFRKWREDLMAALRDFSPSPVVLIMDNVSVHNLPDQITGLREEKLPANTTAKHQPCDQGPINTTKTTYKTIAMSRKLAVFSAQMEELSEEKTRRLAAETLARPGSLGLAAGRSPHVLDAMHIIKESFDEIPASSIVKCWLRAKCLPADVTEVLEGLLRDTPVADDPPSESAAETIFQMLRDAPSLGVGHGNGSTRNELDATTSDGLLIDGNSPDALAVIRDWLAEEDRIPSLMQLLD